MPNQVHIAVDAMSGDEGLPVVVAASKALLASYPNLKLSLIGQAARISELATDDERLLIVDAESVVTMTDKPAHALRKKSESSMAKAIKMLAEGRADACVSAGNTGALMAFGLKHLGAINGISRPAICRAVPTARNKCYLLDLGANIECTAENLRQFAVMGAALAGMGRSEPAKVGLLNIGTEAHKGGTLQQDAADLIRAERDLEFIGFVEGNDVYSGIADVVVCDGFSGNILLKSSEGVALLLQESLWGMFRSAGLMGKLAYAVARPILKCWQKRYDPCEYNGAALLGLKGVVVKSHGSAKVNGFAAALNVAYEQANANWLEQLIEILDKKKQNSEIVV